LPLPVELRDRDGKLLVRDAEAFCAGIIHRRGLGLSWNQRESLLAFLVIECWRLTANHEPDRAAFTSWATPTLQRKIVDWIRSREAELEGFGDGRRVWKFAGYTHVRERPQVISLDADGELGESLAARSSDPADDCDPAFGGRQRTRDLELLGLSKAQGA
jgi:hypothetical protein